jgi:flagellar M-ring protein FliF
LAAPQPPVPDAERVKAQQIFDEVAQHMKREPAQSSRLLQSWIHSD